LNRDRVRDPDLIVPGQELDLPLEAARVAAIEGEESDQVAVAELQRSLDEIDEQAAAEAQAGWRFFDPLAVGAGPPEPEDVPVEIPNEEGDSLPPISGEGIEDSGEDGAQRGGEAGEDLELSGAIWSSLLGWRASAGGAQARTSQKWLRFDERAGRFFERV
jgi:hypothetical protein